MVVIACWSTKGGAGTTVVAAALAYLCARGSARGALAVDLGGDLGTALGVPDSAERQGVADWLAAAPDVPVDGLTRLEEPVGPGLALVRRGRGPLPAPPAELLAGVLAAEPRDVVVDCGRIDVDGDDAGGGAGRVLAAGAGRSLLVLRPCFLSLRRAQRVPLRPSGVVLLAEGGRALKVADIEKATGVPVLARVRVTEEVARAVDVGLLVGRFPRTLARDLRNAA
jgi:hypothetical protein